MGTADIRESILVIGASGRTGGYVVRYLCAASVPVIACVRRAERVPVEARLASAEVAVANLEQPDTIAPLIDRAAHVVYLAGGERRGMSPGAWQLEVESLSSCIEFAQRSGFTGRWLYVGYSGAEQRGGTTWAEARWRELKLAAEQVVTASGLNYFVLRVGRITESVSGEPRVQVSQPSTPMPDADVPCNALGFLLTGVTLAGCTQRARATVRLDNSGVKLQAAVHSFARLRSDETERTLDRLDFSRMSFR